MGRVPDHPPASGHVSPWLSRLALAGGHPPLRCPSRRAIASGSSPAACRARCPARGQAAQRSGHQLGAGAAAADVVDAQCVALARGIVHALSCCFVRPRHRSLAAARPFFNHSVLPAHRLRLASVQLVRCKCTTLHYQSKAFTVLLNTPVLGRSGVVFEPLLVFSGQLPLRMQQCRCRPASAVAARQCHA